MKPQIRQVTSLFLLCQVLLILTHEPLVKVLSCIILEGDADVFTAAGAAKISLYTQSRVGCAKVGKFRGRVGSSGGSVAERM